MLDYDRDDSTVLDPKMCSSCDYLCFVTDLEIKWQLKLKGFALSDFIRSSIVWDATTRIRRGGHTAMTSTEDCVAHMKVTSTLLTHRWYSSNILPENAKLTDPVKINQMLDLAEFVKKETLALYALSKYRHLKRSYES
ncbi:unnamed protein product [Rhizoctonia solani]|uniref:Uncharacterized protein n=1 Tax=Rhizoctonia solani TaxID=456999 RepID=A0A8H3EBE6_9AGAM|nr:unnamed protein product [Rhizoctonia solani]